MRTSADIRADIAAFDAEHNVGADFYRRPDLKVEQHLRDGLCGDFVYALEREGVMQIEFLD